MKDTNLDSYTPLRIGDVPELDIEFIDSTEVSRRPRRAGEPPSWRPRSAMRSSPPSECGSAICQCDRPFAPGARNGRAGERVALMTGVRTFVHLMRVRLRIAAPKFGCEGLVECSTAL